MSTENSLTRPTAAKTVLSFVHGSSVIGFISIAFFLLIFQAQAVFIKVGPFSLSAYATALAAGLMLVSCITQFVLGYHLRSGQIPSRLRAQSLRVFIILWPLILLLLYSSIRLALEWRIEGLQNLLVLTILVVGALALSTETKPEKIKQFFSSYLHISLGVSIVFGGFTLFGLEGFANRQFAMIMMLSLSVAVVWPAPKGVLLIAPYLFAFSIALSQSRTATFVALLLIGLHILSNTRSSRRVALRVVAALFGAGTVISIAILGPPFFESVVGVELGVESRGYLGTNGRLSAWAKFIALLTTPTAWFFGLGTGAAMEYGAAEVSSFSHPHNEYLRFLVDLGILGLILLILGAMFLIIHFARSWSSAEPPGKAALLVIISLGIVATTDGPLYSSFVIIPATLVIGLGLASTLSTHWSPEKQRAKKDP